MRALSLEIIIKYLTSHMSLFIPFMASECFIESFREVLAAQEVG